MAYQYDDQNVFAKILRGEIPKKTVMETEHTLAFEDISAQAPVHILVIPKGPYVTFDHFAAEASDAEIVDLNRTMSKIMSQVGVTADSSDGYRLIANAGRHGLQEVPHLHFHILAGRRLGAMLQSQG